MTPDDVLTGLSPAEKAELTQKDTWRGLIHLIGHVGAIAMSGTYIAFGGPFWWLVLLPHGVLIIFLFTLSHECTHRTPFGPVWLNDTVGHVIGAVIALPFTWFRYFHFAHHKHTGDPDRDPELANPKPRTWPDYAVYLSGWPYWRAVIRILILHALGRTEAAYFPARKHKSAVIEARAILGLYIVALLLWPMLLWLWLIPILIGQPALRLYLLAEHSLCPNVANALENTRTTLTFKVIRWLAWNMPYHAEHHAAPNVPFHKLPQLHAHIGGQVRHTSDGYISFHRKFVDQLEERPPKGGLT